MAIFNLKPHVGKLGEILDNQEHVMSMFTLTEIGSNIHLHIDGLDSQTCSKTLALVRRPFVLDVQVSSNRRSE